MKGSPSKECRLYDPITIKLQKIQTNYGMERTMVLGGRQGEPGGTLTDARRKERNRIDFFFYIPLKLISFLVILHIARVDG